MQKLACRTYLEGQLPKLSHGGEFDRYRDKLPEKFWNTIGVPPDQKRLEAFTSPGFVEQFLNDNEEHWDWLAETLSLHHNNGVIRTIRDHQEWEIQRFPFERVRVGNIEPDLIRTVEHHDRALLKIAMAPEIVGHPHYSERSLENDIGPSTYIGVWVGDNVRLRDGNHRAIHQARQFLQTGSPGNLSIVVPVRMGTRAAR